MLRSFQSRNQKLLLVEVQLGIKVTAQAILTKNGLSQRKGGCKAIWGKTRSSEKSL